MGDNNLTSTNGYLNNNYYASSGSGLGSMVNSNKGPFIKYNRTNNNIVFVNGENEYEIPTTESQDSIIDQVISRLMGEGMADILLDSIISKLSQYLESGDNKELIEDLLNQKILLIKDKFEDDLIKLKMEISDIRENIDRIRTALGLNGNYNDRYYLGDISTRLNRLEATSDRVDGLWANYLGKIDSLIKKDIDNNSNIS